MDVRPVTARYGSVRPRTVTATARRRRPLRQPRASDAGHSQAIAASMSVRTARRAGMGAGSPAARPYTWWRILLMLAMAFAAAAGLLLEAIGICTRRAATTRPAT
ncbi:hypothetical protein [Streptomyces paromomycinus]|uniref:Uncharacterized protein n=1 Tax=Streptomyces paromomycinus TaxID=92743 RepID=A0A401VZ90_STREY|nr:hypothetical protein [Streptomyces paromomycinus]GCD42376.1 hypothetical protein GKJPGBOP_02036 [Streptomyces paromomycinus]